MVWLRYLDEDQTREALTKIEKILINIFSAFHLATRERGGEREKGKRPLNRQFCTWLMNFSECYAFVLISQGIEFKNKNMKTNTPKKEKYPKTHLPLRHADF